MYIVLFKLAMVTKSEPVISPGDSVGGAEGKIKEIGQILPN